MPGAVDRLFFREKLSNPFRVNCSGHRNLLHLDQPDRRCMLAGSWNCRRDAAAARTTFACAGGFCLSTSVRSNSLSPAGNLEFRDRHLHLIRANDPTWPNSARILVELHVPLARHAEQATQKDIISCWHAKRSVCGDVFGFQILIAAVGRRARELRSRNALPIGLGRTVDCRSLSTLRGSVTSSCFDCDLALRAASDTQENMFSGKSSPRDSAG